jgi:methyl-accepting chemotaxis protein
MMNRKRWIAVAIGIGLVFATGGYMADGYLVSRQIDKHGDRLLLLNQLRSSALQAYFDTVSAEVTFWALNDGLRDTLRSLEVARRSMTDDAWRAMAAGYMAGNPFPLGERRLLHDAKDGSDFSGVHATLYADAVDFVGERGYYDFFLILPDGDVVYTVEKEADFGTNLIDGPWRDTGLADVFRGVSAFPDDNLVVFSDLNRYAPSADEPAMFVGAAMLDESGAMQGVLALQVPVDRIATIMHFTAGMGESGETYLVGDDNLMRSDSRFSRTSTILDTRVTSPSVERALGGEEGVTFVDDYRGIAVLSAFSAIEFGEFRWAVMAEIDRDEILSGVGGLRFRVAAGMVALWGLLLWSLWFLRVVSWEDLGGGSGDVGDADLDPG